MSVHLIDPCSEPGWDDFVLHHPFGWITHLSGWKKVLEDCFPHMRARYLAVLGRDGEISAALPLFEVKSRITGHRLVGLPFATLCDPLVSRTEEIDDLLDSAGLLLDETGASYIQLRTHLSSAVIPGGRLLGTNTYGNHYLNLSGSLSELERHFHRTCVRQRISRAIKSGLRIRIGEGERDLKLFYSLHSDMRKRLGLPAPPYRMLEALWNSFHPAGQLSLLLSEFDGKTVGGIVVFKYRDRMSAEFLGWDANFREVSPTHHLFWEAIKMADREGRKTFDFGRSTSLETSLTRFKERWGTSFSDLSYYYYPPRFAVKGEDQSGSFTHRVVKEVCKALPEPAFRMIGSFCYRHMA